MAKRRGKSGSSERFHFWGVPKSLQMVTVVMKLRHLFLGRKTMTNLERILKSRDITLPTRIRARVPRTARRSNQSILSQAWIFVRRTDAEAEAPIFWPPSAKSWLIGKTPWCWKDWVQGWEVGMHHQFNGHEFEQTLGDSEGQGSQACCNHGVAQSWTWLSNWTITRKSR